MQIDQFEDEHAYFGYWVYKIENQSVISHADLVEMMASPHWKYPKGDLITRLCEADKLTEDDLTWLLTLFLPNSYIHNQLVMRSMLNNPKFYWKENLTFALAIPVRWAVYKIVADISSEYSQEALEMINLPQLSKAMRHNLAERIKKEPDK